MADYGKFVVVAEDEWKLHCTKNDACTEFSAKIGGLELDCTLETGKLCITCKEILDDRVDEVHFELFFMIRFSIHPSYKSDLCFVKTQTHPEPVYATMNKENRNWTWSHPGILPTTYQLIVARVLKERNLFPDFALNRTIGRFKNDKKLRVGQQIFHVNKQLLSVLSPYFDGLFNGSFDESKQDVIDTGESDPALYHEFLVALTAPNLCNADVLPNRQNIAGMMRLAKYYQADRLLQHCERHLRMCREMPAEERMELAKKYGSKELQLGLLYDLVPLDDVRLAMRKLIEE